MSPSLSSDLLTKERILVTGGSGFIGTNIVEFYRDRGVGALENFDIRRPRNEAHLEHWRDVNICDASKLDDAIARLEPTAVIHMAARADLIGKTVEDYPDNTIGVQNLIFALRRRSNRPKLLVASSRLVCDIRHRPSSELDYCAPNAYGESKVHTEIITRRDCGNSIPWILVRPTGIWGPWFDVPYRNFFEAVRRGFYLHPRGFPTLKSYGFVGNTVCQIDRLLYADFAAAQGRALYLCDPAVQILQWAKIIAAKSGGRMPHEVPYALLWLGAKIGDRLAAMGVRHPPLTSFRLDNLITDMNIDYMLAQSVVGPAPFSIEDGTDITCDWLKLSIPAPESTH